jgi:CMP-N-acetylneuraminic acid synthetase
MRIVALVPSKLNSERVPSKNIKKLGGIPLVNYCVRALSKVPSVDDVVIFASEPAVCSYILQGLRYRYLERPGYLDSQDTKIQDIIREFLKKDKADIIVLLHITSPFLKTETISECIEKVRSGEFDSAFTAYEMRKFCWYRGKPLNYSLNKPTPRTQDIDPVIVEQSSLYVFKRELFENTGQRTSDNAYVKRVDQFEGHDIDTPEDFRIAELIVNTGMFGIT